MIAYILNLFDLFCTLGVIRLGVRELNPLLQNVPVMIFYKVVIVGVFCWWLSTRRERIARIGLNIAAAVYAILCFYHFYYLFIEVIL